MESLKIDRTKLITVQNYAKKQGMSRPTVYKRIREGVIKTTEIDGITFILL